MKAIEPSKIGCIGCGYVGSLTMIVLAYKNPNLHFILSDCNSMVIEAYKSSLPPFHEPSLDTYFEGCRKHANIRFTTDIDQTIMDSDILFVAVDTPSNTGCGSKFLGRKADLSRLYFLKEVGLRIGKACTKKTKKLIVVLKSTIPLGAEAKFDKYLKSGYNSQDSTLNYSLVCVPEFLAEGTAIENLLHPDRLVIGSAFGCNVEDMKSIRGLYNWIEEKNIIYTNACTAQLAKLASNAMLAQRISSINSLTAICEKTEADIGTLKAAVGSDSRIGPYFLNPSPGFGGSCFKKDVLSLVYICEKLGLHEVAQYWNSIVELNEYQKLRLSQQILETIPKDPKMLTICIFGASFKQGTSDTRDSAAIGSTVCAYLVQNGVLVNIHDPKATKGKFLAEMEVKFEISEEEKERIRWFENPLEAAKGVQGIVILTDWPEFQAYDYELIYRVMITPAYVFDYRRLLNADKLKSVGFNLIQLGVNIKHSE